MAAVPKYPRPVFLNPLKIQLPVTATVSFGHRVSGLLLAIALPFLVCLLDLSLRDAGSYAAVVGIFQRLPVKVILAVLAWGLAHHIAAGLRHLLFDAGVGTRLRAASASAWAVHAFALAVLILVAGALR